MLLSLLCWIFLCVAAGMFASIRRHRSGIGWFFIAFFFSPLVAFVLLVILLPREPEPEARHHYDIEHGPALTPPAPPVPATPIVATFAVAIALAVIALTVIYFAVGNAAAQQTVIRDAQGRTVGTIATPPGSNQSVIRDAQGRTVGTETTYPGTDTVLRDSAGRTVGSIQKGK